MTGLVIGNWKMNLGPAEAVKLATRLDEIIEPTHDVEVAVCPPTIDLVPVAEVLKGSPIQLGAQNANAADAGAYTGEVSAAMLSGLVRYVIIGHSERRAMGETDDEISRKVAAVVRNGLTPVLCVGEKLLDRQHGVAGKVVHDQLVAGLGGLTAAEVAHVVVAYEPIWAIGSGEAARPDDVKPVVSAIRRTVEELYGAEGTVGLRVLYGGSVSAANAADYLHGAEADGLLVGGASIRSEEFAGIIKAVKG